MGRQGLYGIESSILDCFAKQRGIENARDGEQEFRNVNFHDHNALCDGGVSLVVKSKSIYNCIMAE